MLYATNNVMHVVYFTYHHSVVQIVSRHDLTPGWGIVMSQSEKGPEGMWRCHTRRRSPTVVAGNKNLYILHFFGCGAFALNFKLMLISLLWRMLYSYDTYLAIPEIGIRWWNPLTESMTHDESSDVTKSLIFDDLCYPGMMITDWDMLEFHSGGDGLFPKTTLSDMTKRKITDFTWMQKQCH